MTVRTYGDFIVLPHWEHHDSTTINQATRTFGKLVKNGDFSKSILVLVFWVLLAQIVLKVDTFRMLAKSILVVLFCSDCSKSIYFTSTLIN